MEVKKSKRAAIENQRGSWLLMGFVVVLAFMFVTFEWTQHDVSATTGLLAKDPVFEEILIPVTYPEEKTLPPPPPPVQVLADVLNIVGDNEKVTETTVTGTEDIGAKVDVKYVPITAPEEEVVEEPIFAIVEVMPEFPGGVQALMTYLGRNTKYPAIPQEQGIQGKVVVQFVIDKDGTVVDPVVIRGVDPYLDKEAIRVVKSMPRWKPGMQRNKPVRVKYTVPVSFKLQ